MTEYLVDKATNLIKSTHQFPLKFSISGKYVINVPGNVSTFAFTDSVSDILSQKLQGFKSLHETLTNSFTDELITSPNVDSAQSTKFTLGTQKRTAILPGGTLVTNGLVFGSPLTTIFSHWYGFTLHSRPHASLTPRPNEVLVNYDPGLDEFVELDKSIITAEIRNSINSATLATLTIDEEQTVSLPASTYRLRFTNTSSTQIVYLSDWLILY